MIRIKVPTPPYHTPNTHAEEHIGNAVGYIWIYTDTGAATIETQYKNAEQIQQALGVSRATAYRIIARHPKRYWCSDCRDADKPRCFCVVPTKVMEDYVKQPVGNPNFSNGIYQQTIARRLRRKRR